MSASEKLPHLFTEAEAAASRQAAGSQTLSTIAEPSKTKPGLEMEVA